MIAFCTHCKTKQEMRNVEPFTMKNGREARRGTCAVCGGKIVRIGSQPNA